jgi:uncharacterized protein YlbG (UPF0298 family)
MQTYSLIITDDYASCQLNLVASNFTAVLFFKIRKEGIHMKDRQGLIVYVHHLKQAKSLRRYGHVHYISRRLKYVVLYCNQVDVESTIAKLTRLPYVREVLPSYRPFVSTMFENAKPDKAKEYDYKTGL